jgi:hypothetical protein
MESDRLTENQVIQRGGWSSQYAQVRLIVQDDDVAVTIVDGNGDGAEFETELWNRGPKGWVDQGSSGGICFGMGSVLETGAMIGGAGVGEPNEIVTVRFQGATYECQTNDLGYWGFVHRCDDLSEHAQVFRPSV